MSRRQGNVHAIDAGYKGEDTHQNGNAGHQLEYFVEVVGRDGTVGLADIAQSGQA